MVKNLFENIRIKAELRKCQSASPANCRYHGLYLNLNDAIKAKDTNRYLTLKTAIAEADRERNLKDFIQQTNPTSTETTPTKTDITVPPEAAKIADTFTTDKNGRISVLSKDHLETIPNHLNSYLFGEHTDLPTAKQLHENDPYKEFQNGDCADLAWDLYNNNPHVKGISEVNIEGENSLGEPEASIHVIAQLTNGNYIDSLGIWTKDTLEKAWKATDPTSHITDFPPPEKKQPTTKTHPILKTLNTLTNQYFATSNETSTGNQIPVTVK